MEGTTNTSRNTTEKTTRQKSAAEILRELTCGRLKQNANNPVKQKKPLRYPPAIKRSRSQGLVHSRSRAASIPASPYRQRIGIVKRLSETLLALLDGR